MRITRAATTTAAIATADAGICLEAGLVAAAVKIGAVVVFDGSEPQRHPVSPREFAREVSRKERVVDEPVLEPGRSGPAVRAQALHRTRQLQSRRCSAGAR